MGNRVGSSVEHEDGTQEATQYRHAEPGSGNRLLETETLSIDNTSSTASQSFSSQRYNEHGAPVARGGLKLRVRRRATPGTCDG